MTTSATVAYGLATVLVILSPLVLRYLPMDGLTMSAVSYVVSFVLSLGAFWLTGDLHLDKASLLAVLGGSAPFWSVQQGVFKILAQLQPALVHGPSPQVTAVTPVVKPAAPKGR